MTAAEIKQAFKENLPVVMCLPNQPEKQFSHIEAVIYKRSAKGNIMCSALLVDRFESIDKKTNTMQQGSSVIEVRCKYLKMKGDVTQ